MNSGMVVDETKLVEIEISACGGDYKTPGFVVHELFAVTCGFTWKGKEIDKENVVSWPALTHLPSGYMLIPRLKNVAKGRTMARILATLPIPWFSADTDLIKLRVEELPVKVKEWMQEISAHGMKAH